MSGHLHLLILDSDLLGCIVSVMVVLHVHVADAVDLVFQVI